MEKKEYIEIGKIINTHGVIGEVKVEYWADSSKTLHNIKTYYIDSKPYEAERVRDFKQYVLIKFKGIDSLNEALFYKNKPLYICRKDLNIPKGKILRVDIIGLDCIDKATNKVYGKVKDILDYPANSIFVIETDKGDVLLPNVDAFVSSIDEIGVYVTPIDGLFNWLLWDLI